MLALEDTWVWDFWMADDGQAFHLFFLQAPTSIGDPELRHTHVSIGHATSSDLRTWTPSGTALAPGPPGADDSTATWTGSVLADPAGGWVMLFTGGAATPGGIAQSVLAARSADLTTWAKVENTAVRPTADRYETFDAARALSADFRDPWLLEDPAGNGWHALITARSRSGVDDERGVLGHAWSPDLVQWRTQAPLSEPGQGFPFLEVPQVVLIEDRWWLIFSCPADEVSRSRRPAPTAGGIWFAAAAGPLGPFDIAGARQLVDDDLYSGRVVTDRSGQPVLMGFHRNVSHPRFGCISDPLPLRIVDAALRLDPG